MFFDRFKRPGPAPTVPLNFQNRTAQAEGIPVVYDDPNSTSPSVLFLTRNHAALRNIFYACCAEDSGENMVALAALVGFRQSPTFRKAYYIANHLLPEVNVAKTGLQRMQTAVANVPPAPEVRGRKVEPPVSPLLLEEAENMVQGNVSDTMSRIVGTISGNVRYYKIVPRGARVPASVSELQRLVGMGFSIPSTLLSA